MSLIESHEVELAMIAFGKSLGSWESSGIKPKEIEDISYALAHCMKQSLSKTWRPASGKEVRDTACPYDN
jgi:hypothetical protein